MMKWMAIAARRPFGSTISIAFPPNMSRHASAHRALRSRFSGTADRARSSPRVRRGRFLQVTAHPLAWILVAVRFLYVDSENTIGASLFLFLDTQSITDDDVASTLLNRYRRWRFSATEKSSE
jgi:hypothetical protein